MLKLARAIKPLSSQSIFNQSRRSIMGIRASYEEPLRSPNDQRKGTTPIQRPEVTGKPNQQTKSQKERPVDYNDNGNLEHDRSCTPDW